jgi:hypothetical protein
VPLVIADITEELIASIIRVKRIRELGATSAVEVANADHSSLILVTLVMKAIHSSQPGLERGPLSPCEDK